MTYAELQQAPLDHTWRLARTTYYLSGQPVDVWSNPQRGRLWIHVNATPEYYEHIADLVTE